jgi:hypothetical protein
MTTSRTSGWTRVQLHYLRELHASGMTQVQMAEALGRTKYEIQSRLRHLKLTRLTRSERPDPDAQLLDVQDVLKLMREITRHVGTGWQSELARAAGVPPSAVCQVVLGLIKPGDRLLEALGLRKVVLYEVVGEPVAVVKSTRRVKRSAVPNAWDPRPVVMPPGAHAKAVTVHRARG